MNKFSLKTKYIARQIYFYEEIDSTQKEIWRQIAKGNIKNGGLIITKRQSSGIGTHGRSGYSDEKSLILSLALFSAKNVEKYENFTYEIAVLLVNVFKRLYNIDLDIKSPNDLMIMDKKVGGILVETKILSGQIKEMVIGVGINTNMTFIPEELKKIATSIKNEYGVEIDNMRIIAEFCNDLEELYEKRRL